MIKLDLENGAAMLNGFIEGASDVFHVAYKQALYPVKKGSTNGSKKSLQRDDGGTNRGMED